MAFKALFMLVPDVSLDAKRYMVMMLPKQRSPHQGLAIAGQNGAAVSGAMTRTRRKKQKLSRRRRKGCFSREQKISLLHMLLMRSRKAFQVQRPDNLVLHQIVLLCHP
jgi:hypothetical protein